MGAFGSGFLFVNIYALTQKVVPGNHVGKASGIASSAHYLTAGFAGGLLGTLVQAFGWSTGTLIQMVLLPIVTIICIVLVKIDPPNVAKDSSSLSS